MCVVRGNFCAKMSKVIPDNFRLVKKPNDELVLQGHFSFQCNSCGANGSEWKDLPTIVLPSLE